MLSVPADCECSNYSVATGEGHLAQEFNKNHRCSCSNPLMEHLNIQCKVLLHMFYIYTPLSLFIPLFKCKVLTNCKSQLQTSLCLLFIVTLNPYNLICDVLSHKPWILLEVGPQTQCDIFIFHHSLHVACLGVDVRTGPLWAGRNTARKKTGMFPKSPSHRLGPCKNTNKQRVHIVTRCFVMCKYHYDSCTLRVSSVVRRCLEWISSCKFMSASWYFWTSCGCVTSLSRTSSSSISYKGHSLCHRLCNTSDPPLSKESFIIQWLYWSFLKWACDTVVMILF